MDYCPFLVSFTICGAQNLPPPLPPLRPPLGGGLTSGCLATTVNPTRTACSGFAIADSGEYMIFASASLGTM